MVSAWHMHTNCSPARARRQLKGVRETSEHLLMRLASQVSKPERMARVSDVSSEGLSDTCKDTSDTCKTICTDTLDTLRDVRPLVETCQALVRHFRHFVETRRTLVKTRQTLVKNTLNT
jgi:hypothetical protein